MDVQFCDRERQEVSCFESRGHGLFLALISNVASKNNYTCQTIDLMTFTWIE
jgi:hypothetical protein